jgi:hypothetical protein
MATLQINPWRGIWVRTRETIRAIVQFNPRYMLPLLYFIYGLPMFFQMAQNFSLGDRYSLTGIIVVALLLSIVLGLVMINIGAGLLYWTGKWIGGIGSFQNIRAAVAWSNVPNAVNILLWFINIAAFGSRIFKQEFIETPFAGHELGLIFFTAVVQVVLAVWSFIIVLRALSEVQGFSMWRAFFNLIIPGLVIFAAIFILGFLVSMMAGTPGPNQLK